ncbi:colicin immunity domain-containing protein [Streptomyces sp. NPDC048527]|uniref:colicin immunity domain-containing protein n=2 Tax=unclassified Streptomyces TaxID=2593676 RepID=UPI003723E696
MQRKTHGISTQSEAPHIAAVSADYPPLNRPWKAPRDVPSGSHTGRQLALMRRLQEGAVDGPTFARGWLGERRGAMAAGERVGDALGSVLDEVFYTLDDYTIDPAIRDAEDLTDGELQRRVAAAFGKLGDCDAGS